MAKDILPAISESEASGEVAELYADVRTTPKVSAINYVWRHIAASDGDHPHDPHQADAASVA